MGVTLVEASLRRDLPQAALDVPVTLAIAATLWVRRTRPFGAFMLAFALTNALTITAFVRGLPREGMHAGAFVLLHPYALFRYGAWREAALGAAVMAFTYVASMIEGDLRGAEAAIGAAVVMSFPAALGAVARFRELAMRRDIEAVRLRERQMLARELHDTVAHHVAAIAIQAQAARAVLARRPEAAERALGTIEREASRALGELRSLVATLRDNDPASSSPQAGLREIEALIRDLGARASLELVGDLDHLPPAVEHALHRIAREALHNAATHGQGVQHVAVRIAAEGPSVRLSVIDDGAPAGAPTRQGFGLVGMSERANLLGGTFEAGPLPSRGWRVEAVLPLGGGAP